MRDIDNARLNPIVPNVSDLLHRLASSDLKIAGFPPYEFSRKGLWRAVLPRQRDRMSFKSTLTQFLYMLTPIFFAEVVRIVWHHNIKGSMREQNSAIKRVPKSLDTVSSAPRPTITVLMPVYNGANFLEEQVASILAQRGVDLRIVAVNDGSSDNSLAILKRLARQDNRLSIMDNRSNIGLIRSLAQLLGEVQGDYFSLADQDDVWDNNKLIRSIKALERTGAVLVYSDVRVIDVQGREIASSYLRPRGLRPQVGRDPVPFIFRNPAIGHTIVARAELAPEARRLPPDMVFHEAWIIGAACMVGEVTYLDERLGGYRQHGGNVIGAKGSALKRLARLFGKGGTLERRQRTRVRAIAALSHLYPKLIPIAELQERHGLARWLSLPRFAAFLMPYVGSIGIGSVLAEILLFPFTADMPRSRGKTP